MTRYVKSKYTCQSPFREVKPNLILCIPWRSMGRVDDWFHLFLTLQLNVGERWAICLGQFIPKASFQKDGHHSQSGCFCSWEKHLTLVGILTPDRPPCRLVPIWTILFSTQQIAHNLLDEKMAASSSVKIWKSMLVHWNRYWLGHRHTFSTVNFRNWPF
jgi:hypothetical protein